MLWPPRTNLRSDWAGLDATIVFVWKCTVSTVIWLAQTALSASLSGLIDSHSGGPGSMNRLSHSILPVPVPYHSIP